MGLPRCSSRAGALAVLLSAAAASTASAQKTPMEFTRQGILVLNFTPGAGADVKLGRRVGDRVRDRLEEFVNKREVDVISARLVRDRLERDGYDPDAGLDPKEFFLVSRLVRSDEWVTGTVTRRAGAYQVVGELHLVRNTGTKQPLEIASGADVDALGDALARAIVATRAQLVHERRCMNALREGRGAQALEAARAGIAAVPRGAFARACQVLSLVSTHAPAADVLSAAEALLAIDSTSREGLEGAGLALNTLGRRDRAAEMWLRFALTDTGNVELTLRAGAGLLAGNNARAALPMLARAIAFHPDSLSLVQLQWQAAYTAKEWALAATVGDSLAARDRATLEDPVFQLRHAAAHRAAGHGLYAMELAVRGVQHFPKDAPLYVLYAELVEAERDSVVPRGLAAFPKSAELHAIAAKDLKSRGRAEESLAAMQQAVALDSTLPQGVLAIAQAEFDLGRPDSALVSLTRAWQRHEDAAAVAQFALAKGNVLMRAATQTQLRDDFARALRFFQLADTVRPTPQSKFLSGTAALNIAKGALTDAPKLTDKVAACALAKLGSEMVVAARNGLTAGAAVAADAAKQYLEYVEQIAPFGEKQVALYCTEPAASERE